MSGGNFYLPQLSSSYPFLQEWRKFLSTATKQTSSSPLPPVDGSNRPFGEGRLYGKVSRFSKYYLKVDVMNLLEGSNVTSNDLKFSYARGGNLNPAAVYVQFPSLPSYDRALRTIVKKGKLYRLERAARSQWDPIVPYEGKVAWWGTLFTSAIEIERTYFRNCRIYCCFFLLSARRN